MHSKSFVKNGKHIEQTLKRHAFHASWYLKNPHVQIAAFYLTPYFTLPQPKTERRFIMLPDGSKMAADCWFQTKKEQKETIIIIPGFESYYEGKSRFGEGVGYKAYNRGYNVIFLRQRGEGDTIHLTKSLGDFFVDDLPKALFEISTWSEQKMYIISLSLGAWSALLTVGRMGASPPHHLAGLVAISAPTNTYETWAHIEKSTVYNALLLKKYKGLITRRIQIDPPGTWDREQFKKIKTKRQFFQTYMHTFGYPQKFSTIDEYFSATDVMRYVHKIAIPTCIIHANDDPVVPAEPFKRHAVVNNPSIITLLSNHGSHGCFITPKVLYEDLDRHWAQNRAIEFIKLLQ